MFARICSERQPVGRGSGLVVKRGSEERFASRLKTGGASTLTKPWRRYRTAAIPAAVMLLGVSETDRMKKRKNHDLTVVGPPDDSARLSWVVRGGRVLAVGPRRGIVEEGQRAVRGLEIAHDGVELGRVEARVPERGTRRAPYNVMRSSVNQQRSGVTHLIWG